MIYYFCPDQTLKSGGIRQLYKHVSILASHDIPAYILHSQSGFRIPDLPDVPIKYLQEGNCLQPGNILVIPEGFPGIMMKTRDLPIRRLVFALNWSYAFNGLQNENWASLGIERAFTVSPFIAKVVEWSMQIPVDILPFSLDPQLYHNNHQEKRRKIVYFGRKAKCIDQLTAMLRCRNTQWLTDIQWNKLENLDEPAYANELREASLYLALGTEEGINQSVFEAMKCGTLVAGFNGIGLKDELVGKGKCQNCLLAENGDYASLAMMLEPVLNDLISDSFGNWQAVIENGERLASPYTPEAETLAVLSLWQNILKSG